MTNEQSGSPGKEAPASVTRIGVGRWRLAGDLGLAQVSALALNAPPAAEAGRMVLDLGGVGRTSSAAVALLLEWQAGLCSCGADLTLVNAPASLCRLAALSNVDGLLGLGDAAAATCDDTSAAVPRPS